jgi:hypothetical protein
VVNVVGFKFNFMSLHIEIKGQFPEKEKKKVFLNKKKRCGTGKN